MRFILAALLLLVLIPAAPASAHLRYCDHGTHRHWASFVQFDRHWTAAGQHWHQVLMVPQPLASPRLVKYPCARS